MKKKKLHTTLLALMLVFVPPYFLVFTEEGNRISDNVILWLFGQESLLVNLAEADRNFSESQVREVYPDLDWQCGKQPSRFGQRACNAAIGTFNEIPARNVLILFADDQLTAIQIRYRSQYHNSLLQQLIDTLGQPETSMQAISNTPDADPVLQWDTGKGLVLLKKTIRESDQAVLMWLGAAQ